LWRHVVESALVTGQEEEARDNEIEIGISEDEVEIAIREE
jgi:hypothetical protein